MVRRINIVARVGMVLMIMALGVVGCRETADLGETSWELVAYGPADEPIPAEASASIGFEDNGRMGGYTGCNGFFGHYEAVDGRINLDDEIAFTAAYCDPASPEGAQDAFFRQWLGDADYLQMADRLVLYFSEGRQVAEYRLSDE